jgi:hypothetical protein
VITGYLSRLVRISGDLREMLSLLQPPEGGHVVGQHIMLKHLVVFAKIGFGSP